MVRNLSNNNNILLIGQRIAKDYKAAALTGTLHINYAVAL